MARIRVLGMIAEGVGNPAANATALVKLQQREDELDALAGLAMSELTTEQLEQAILDGMTDTPERLAQTLEAIREVAPEALA